MGSFTTGNFVSLFPNLGTEIWIPDAVTPATGTAGMNGRHSAVDEVASACCCSGGCCTLDDEDAGKGTGTTAGASEGDSDTDAGDGGLGSNLSLGNDLVGMQFVLRRFFLSRKIRTSDPQPATRTDIRSTSTRVAPGRMMYSMTLPKASFTACKGKSSDNSGKATAAKSKSGRQCTNDFIALSKKSAPPGPLAFRLYHPGPSLLKRIAR